MSHHVKDLIDRLENTMGLREAAKKLGTSHQRLMNLRDKGENAAAIVDLVNRIEKLLGISHKEGLRLCKKKP